MFDYPLSPSVPGCLVDDLVKKAKDMLKTVCQNINHEIGDRKSRIKPVKNFTGLHVWLSTYDHFRLMIIDSLANVLANGFEYPC